jgi:hypothetical protein
LENRTMKPTVQYGHTWTGVVGLLKDPTI